MPPGEAPAATRRAGILPAGSRGIPAPCPGRQRCRPNRQAGRLPMEFGLAFDAARLGLATMIARVTLEIALRREFDYAIPNEMADRIEVGSRVKVPFGARD